MKHGHKTPLRLLSLLLTVLMLMSIAPVSVFAADGDPTIQVGSATALPGGTVTLDIKLKDNPGIASAAVNVSFDSTVLTLQKITYGESFAANGEQPETMTSPVTLSWGNLSNISGDVTFASLEFLVSAAAPEGTTDVTLSYDASNIINIDEDDVDFQIENGSIEVVNGIPGDINADGERNMKDLLRARKYFAGWDVETDPIALDANYDGTVNIKDLLRLRKFFANWYVKIHYGATFVYPTSSTIQYVPYKDPTCEVAGNIAYWYNASTGKCYSDAAGTTEITQESTVIATTGHTPVTDPAVAATYTSTGLTEGSHCSVCQKVLVAQEVVPVLTGTQWSITYNVAGSDSYLKSITIDNPNPSIYTEGVGLTLEELEVDGYIFEGWYDGQGSSANRVTQITSSDSGNKKLYAHWSKDTYTIKFVSSLYPIDDLEYSADTGAVLPTPSLSNYVFTGWTDEEGNLLSGNVIKPGTARNMTLTANWTSERNKTWTKKQLDDPIIYRDDENDVIYFAYEIGEIQNVPLYTVKDFGYISGDGVTKTETVTYSSKVSQAETQAYVTSVTNATTASSSWTLSDGWTNSTSVNSEYAQSVGLTEEEVKERSTSETGTWNISNGTSGSKSTTVLASDSRNQQNEVKVSNTTTDASKTSATVKESDSLAATVDTQTKVGVSSTASVENTATVGASLSAGVEGSGAKVGGEVSASDSLKTGLSTTVSSETTVGSSVTSTHEDERTYSAESSYAKTNGTEKGVTVGGEQLTSVSSTGTSSWNSEYSYGGSNTTTNTDTTSWSLAREISEKTGYGQEYIQTGNQSSTQGNTQSSAEENQYSSTVAYSTETSEEVTMTWTTQSTKPGYHRWVKAGTAHVFAIVGYDIAKSAYFVSTYSIMDAETHDFEDYSYTTAAYNDNENGVITFEVPYEVTEYVANLTAASEGLRVDRDTGIITEYTGSDNAVIIPEYIIASNGDGTNDVVKVTGFTENVFKGNTNIKAVVLSNYITEIPARAFKGCTSLLGVGAKSVTSIGEEAFAGCVNFYGAYVSSAVTSLGRNAFENVYSLFVRAANPSVVENAINSGADNILLYLDEMKDGSGVSTLSDTKLTVPDSTLIFVLNGYGSTFNNVTIESNAKGTIINRASFVSSRGIPLQIASSETILNQVSVIAPGLGLVMKADTASLGLQGTVSVDTSGANAVLTKSLELYQSNNAVVGALKANGKILVCGTITGGELTDPASETIDEATYNKLLTSYTITFDPGEGTCETQSKEIPSGEAPGELPVPTREYYDFDGWFTEAEGGTELTAETISDTDITVYAHWTIQTCTITFDANGGYVDTESKTLNVGGTVGELPTPTRDYYSFDGWFTEAEGGTEVTAETPVTDNVGYTVYAHWTQHEVSGWVLASEMPSDAETVSEKWSYTLTTNVENRSSSMDGYTLIGSYWQQTGTGSVNYASFPSGFDTSNWIYTSFAQSAYGAYDNGDTKRDVSNTWSGYVYWHWMYDCGGGNGTSTRAIYHQYGYGSDNGYLYKYFGAFTSTNGSYSSDRYYCNSQSIQNYIVPERTAYSDCQGATRWFRFDYYTSYYTDYQKIYQHQKVENLESASYISEGNGISNVQHWVQYRAK